MSTPKPTSILKPTLPIPISALLAVQLAIIKTAYS